MSPINRQPVLLVDRRDLVGRCQAMKQDSVDGRMQVSAEGRVAAIAHDDHRLQVDGNELG